VRRPRGAVTPLQGLVRLQPGAVGLLRRLVVLPLARCGVPDWCAAGLAAAIVFIPLLAGRPGSLPAGAAVGAVVAAGALADGLCGRWPPLRRLCWPAAVALLSLTATMVTAGPGGFLQLGLGLAGQNGAPLPLALEPLGILLKPLTNWRPSGTDHPLIAGQGVGLLALFVLLSAIYAAQAVPRLFDRTRAGRHSVWFALALYFVVAWYFAASPIAAVWRVR
jgi:hypothetical protein